MISYKIPIPMPDVLIRNIDEKTLKKLKARASENNRSLQAELHDMIDKHAGHDLSKFKNLIKELQEEYKVKGVEHSDSVKEIREQREGR